MSEFEEILTEYNAVIVEFGRVANGILDHVIETNEELIVVLEDIKQTLVS